MISQKLLGNLGSRANTPPNLCGSLLLGPVTVSALSSTSEPGRCAQPSSALKRASRRQDRALNSCKPTVESLPGVVARQPRSAKSPDPAHDITQEATRNGCRVRKTPVAQTHDQNSWTNSWTQISTGSEPRFGTSNDVCVDTRHRHFCTPH